MHIFQSNVHENCELMEGIVYNIDRKNKIVTLENGESVEYEKLVICGGAWTNSLLKKAELELLPIFMTYEMSVNFNYKEVYEGKANLYVRGFFSSYFLRPN